MAYHCIKYINKECDGCGGCQPPDPHYHCPICGDEVYETVYINMEGEVIGCESCVRTKEPYEVLDDKAY